MPTLIVLILCCAAPASDTGAVPAQPQARCLAVLHQALSEGKVWVKVHAAESLLWTGHPEGVRDIFLEEEKTAGPQYRIGVWRVLAQAAPDEQARKQYVDKITAVFFDLKASDRLHASETLGKLGYTSHDPEVLRVAEKGEKSFQSMARWIMANSGDAKDEAYLAELLTSEDPETRSCSAYALRFLKTIRPETYAKLKAAAEKEPHDSQQRALILSPAYLHAPEADKTSIHAQLIQYADTGTKDDKREVCAALGRRPNPEDLPILTRLLDDPDLDAQAGAAEAILRIARSQKDT